jgi:hypothetical protein
MVLTLGQQHQLQVIIQELDLPRMCVSMCVVVTTVVLLSAYTAVDA